MGKLVPGTFADEGAAAGNGTALEVRKCLFQLRLRGEHAESSVPSLVSGWQVKYAEVAGIKHRLRAINATMIFGLRRTDVRNDIPTAHDKVYRIYLA